MKAKLDDWLNEKITVCDKCLTAACWYGIFMCDEAQWAGTVEKTRRELIALHRESTDYMMADGEKRCRPIVIKEIQ